MFENNDHYQPWLWVGRVDQKEEELMSKRSLVFFFFYNKNLNPTLTNEFEVFKNFLHFREFCHFLS